MRLLLLCALVTAVTAVEENRIDDSSDLSPWTWRCESGRCMRRPVDEATDGMQFNSCKLTCGDLSVVWPRPTGPAMFGKKTVPFLLDRVKFTLTAPGPVKPMLQEATEIFLSNLRVLHPVLKHPQKAGCTRAGHCPPALAERLLRVVVVVDSDIVRLSVNTSEFHQVLINQTQDGDMNVLVYAPTFFGARHGLETVSQLINYDDQHACLQVINMTMLSDAPVYPVRALTIDTARNFISLAGLRRTVDAMSMNKLNTLHWHITDTHSFPIEVGREPRMAQYGAYSPQEVYTATEVRDLVSYAQQRGVRLLPELDAPAHVGYGWQWGEKAGLGKLAVCVGEEPWTQYCVEPPCGQMNIINENMYKVLEKIYADFNDMFDPDIFHVGGDEINLNCWKSTPEIAAYVKDHGGDPTDDHEYMNLWVEYQSRAADIWRNVSGHAMPLVLWTSDLTAMPSRASRLTPHQYWIQVWTTGDDAQIGELLRQGFKVIMSNYDAWYLDCGFSAWVGSGNNWCSPYKSWQTVYDNSPRAIARSFQTKVDGGGAAHDYADLVVGGSAALWAEQSDDQTLDQKLWPRGAALAERLWAEPETGSAEALTRFVHHRERMVGRGVAAESLQPQYCHLNDGVCL
ncbi:chitooligosaccharidolytic beta-N-acetylglucosaminidase-like [Pollicipes pollicipes]|uniref:chitooligosaccharidolytic beta-N-acetylglucosaminidase-like n=1 Tax=Pollicipes pollicipes TaxID=41117 RepID=UPI001884FA3A|nr:chitooligosaccharidolytic beta-N-acetylglucosaminidase-like [Pollicipes pollicipes]